MNDNIKAGADIHAGDGGYSIGTQEKYDEFVKGRNQSLGKMRIRELAIEADIMAPTWNHVPLGHQKFAELIVRECIRELEISRKCDPYTGNLFDCEYNTCIKEQSIMLTEHFGVEL
jgi:hypothetical protein